MARGSSDELPILVILGLLIYYAYKKGHLTGILGPGTGGGGNGGGGSGNGNGGGGGGTGGTAAFVQFGDPDDCDIVTNAVSHGTNNILITGDFCKRCGSAQEWFDDCASQLSGKNVYGTKGNHDSDSDVSAISGNAGAWEFTIDLGSIGVIGIDTFDGDQNFLTSAVETFQADTSKKAIVVFGHAPIRAPSGSHHPAENTGYHSIFTANSKVKLVLNGHNHNMTVMDVDGIKYVCNGSADPEKYPAGNDEQVEFANDSDTGVTVVKDGGSSLNVELVSNGGESLYSFSVPY